jgi:hypothetical protein
VGNARGICQASGFEFPLSELVRQWNGLLVHPLYWERRNPQDFLRGVPESTLAYSSPEPPDTFVNQILTGRDQFEILRARDGDTLISRDIRL